MVLDSLHDDLLGPSRGYETGRMNTSDTWVETHCGTIEFGRVCILRVG